MALDAAELSAQGHAVRDVRPGHVGCCPASSRAPLLLLDEPTSALDLGHQIEVFELIRQLADQGKTLVMVVHDLVSACRYADQMIAMSGGAVLAQGAPTDILDKSLIHQLYGVHCDIIQDPATGTPLLVNLTKSSATPLKPGCYTPPVTRLSSPTVINGLDIYFFGVAVMSESSSTLVEQLWRLKRLVDRGECSSIEFVHLNNLLREPGYRADVLRRAEASGSDRVRRLVQEIRANDSESPLMAQPRSTASAEKVPQHNDKPPTWVRRNFAWLAPVTATIAVAIVGFTALEPQTIRVTEDITSSVSWKSGKTYVLEKTIFVDGGQLTIEPGVTVKGENGSALIVTRESKLFSRGQAGNPVVFTSAKPVGERKRGDWGGVVLLGRAPVNQPNAQIEGLPASDQRGRFGGRIGTDSCGVVEYTRIEFAGFEVYQNNELNGLTLGGCGSHTIIRNVQIHRALDDGIEMFGGTVDLEKILITGAADDSIDWDWGWRGRVQFAVIQHHPDAGDNAFEGDNNGNQHETTPRSEPVFYNVTLVGTGQSPKSQRGMVLREGTGGHFHNLIIDSYGIEALDTRDEARSLVTGGQLVFSHNIIANTGRIGGGLSERGQDDDDYGFEEGDWLRAPANNNRITLNSALHPVARDLRAPDFRPRVSLRDMSARIPPKSEFFDESAVFSGAINPRSETSWLTDWTAFPES